MLKDVFGATCNECGELLPPEDFDQNNNYIGDHEHVGDENDE